MNEVAESWKSISYTLRQLECFVAVANCGSISAAARMIHASESAVSDSIKILEQSLGTTLLHRRRSQGVTLTSDGLTILPLARNILFDAEGLSLAVGADVSEFFGPVRIGALGTLAPVFLPELIKRAEETLPKIKISTVLDDQSELFSGLFAGELDLVVCFDIDVPETLQQEVLGSTAAQVVISADHPLAAQDQVDLRQVEHEPMVLLDIHTSRLHTLELMAGRGITPNVRYRTPDYQFCLSMVAAGLGYSLLMSRNIPIQAWNGLACKALRIEPSLGDRRVVAVCERNPSPRVRALIDILRELRSPIFNS